MIFLDGVYVDRGVKLNRFAWIKAPSKAKRLLLTHIITLRIGRHLERLWLLVRDAGHSYLSMNESEEDPMN